MIDQESVNARIKASIKRQEYELDVMFRRWEITKSDRSDLESLLAELKANRKIKETCNKLAVVKTAAEQIDNCKELLKSAKFISSQLTYFKQLTPLNGVLRQQYELHAGGDAEAQAEKSTLNLNWEAFSSHLQEDTELLAKLASGAMPVMKARAKSSAKGRPSKTWRDNSFTKLFNEVGHVFDGSKTSRVKLAMDLWSIYFPEDCFEDEGHAMRVLAKTRP